MAKTRPQKVLQEPKTTPTPTSERRDQPRHHTVRFTAKLIDGDEESLCLLRDISPEGMKANIYSDLNVDESTLVEFPNGQRIPATLIWAQDGIAGFRFADPIDLDGLLHPSGSDFPRRAPRIHFETVARLIIEDGAKLVKVHDVSLGGAKLETGPVGLSGDHVNIQFDGLPVKGAWIRWINGNSTGVQFDQPMSFDELSIWLNARRPRRIDGDADSDERENATTV